MLLLDGCNCQCCIVTEDWTFPYTMQLHWLWHICDRGHFSMFFHPWFSRIIVLSTYKCRLRNNQQLLASTAYFQHISLVHTIHYVSQEFPVRPISSWVWLPIICYYISAVLTSISYDVLLCLYRMLTMYFVVLLLITKNLHITHYTDFSRQYHEHVNLYSKTVVTSGLKDEQLFWKCLPWSVRAVLIYERFYLFVYFSCFFV